MYKIPLEGKQVKKNQVTGMHLMAGFLLIVMGMFTWLVPNDIKQEEFIFLNWAGLSYAFLGIAIVIICIFFNKRIIQTKANFTLRILEVCALTLVLIYSLMQKWYLPAGYSGAALLGIILAFYWEKSGKQSRVATVHDDGLHIPRLGRNNLLLWQDINRVLFRHNILTIDCKDNRLIQLTVENTSPNGIVNKEEFEQYCYKKIEEKKDLRKEDW
jgi:hypothetical protein